VLAERLASEAGRGSDDQQAGMRMRRMAIDTRARSIDMTMTTGISRPVLYNHDGTSVRCACTERVLDQSHWYTSATVINNIEITLACTRSLLDHYLY